jgi:hypothetical protein
MGGSCQGSGRAEHPTRNLPRWCVARGVLGYREASRCGFSRSVASSTHISSIRLDEGRPGSRPEGIFLLSDRAVTSLGQLRTNLWPLQFLGSETAAIRDQERMPYRPFVPEVLDNRTSRPSRHFSQGVSPTFERSFGVAHKTVSYICHGFREAAPFPGADESVQLARRGNGAPALGRDRRPRSSLAGEGFDEVLVLPRGWRSNRRKSLRHFARQPLVRHRRQRVSSCSRTGTECNSEAAVAALPRGCPGYWRYPEAFVGSR